MKRARDDERVVRDLVAFTAHLESDSHDPLQLEVIDYESLMDHLESQVKRRYLEAIRIPNDVLHLIFRYLSPAQAQRIVRRLSRHFKDWVDTHTHMAYLKVNRSRSIMCITSAIWKDEPVSTVRFHTQTKGGNDIQLERFNATLQVGSETVSIWTCRQVCRPTVYLPRESFLKKIEIYLDWRTGIGGCDELRYAEVYVHVKSQPK
jgi:hypothetical protein